MLLAYGHSTEGLFKVLERSIVWQTVRQFANHFGFGVMILLTVCLFAWKIWSSARKKVRDRA